MFDLNDLLYRTGGSIQLVVCEMNGIITKGGKRYFLTFIDDATKFYHIYLLETKDEAIEYFKTYKADVENQSNKTIKRW